MKFKTSEGIVEIETGRENRMFTFAGMHVDVSDGISLIIDGQKHEAQITKVGDCWWVHLFGHTIQLEYIEPGSIGSEQSGSLIAPMPGKILEVYVAIGDAVKASQPLMMMEAMKMEHRIVASHDGVVKAIHFNAGEQVAQGAELLSISE